MDVIDVTSKVSQGQTSATVSVSTDHDSFALGGFVTSVATTRPICRPAARPSPT